MGVVRNSIEPIGLKLPSAWSPSARHASRRRLQTRPSHAATNFDLADLTAALAGMSEMRSGFTAMIQTLIAAEQGSQCNEDSKIYCTRLVSIMYFPCAVATEDINDKIAS